MTQLPFVLTQTDLAEAPLGWTPPAWWPELETRRTILVHGLSLLRPAIRAFADEEVLVVITPGSKAVEGPLPENIRVERFVPYARLMPKIDLLVTGGGYGAIRLALAHGVPVVAVATPDKPEVANFVQWSGVGIGLKTSFPSEEQLRTAATHVLYQPAYRSRAQKAAALVEELTLAWTA
jgi:UDP:flavonoid glycosyltransferase YjiC (YdhE family)